MFSATGFHGCFYRRGAADKIFVESFGDRTRSRNGAVLYVLLTEEDRYMQELFAEMFQEHGLHETSKAVDGFERKEALW